MSWVRNHPYFHVHVHNSFNFRTHLHETPRLCQLGTIARLHQKRRFLFVCLFLLWSISRKVNKQQKNWDSLLVRAPDSWSKGCEFESDRSGGRIFFSRFKLVCWILLGVRSTPVSPQRHVNAPGHSANSAGGMLHLNTHTPLTQRSRHGLAIPLSRHSVGTYSETSSHATCHRTFGHNRLSSLSHHGLILA